MNKFFSLVVMIVLSASLAQAAPEVRKIKSEERQKKEDVTRESTKRIRLAKIQDPEARKAIQTILNYLDLPAKQ